MITVGKRPNDHHILADAARLAASGVEVHRTTRGGDVTYHGPGQLVAYPVVALRGVGVGARAYVEGLEDVMIAAAASFGVRARGRVPAMAGVWVGERKLGAVGVRVGGGVSTHGMALNVDPSLERFEDIVPCGLRGRGVTSLARERGEGGGGWGRADARGGGWRVVEERSRRRSGTTTSTSRGRERRGGMRDGASVSRPTFDETSLAREASAADG